MKVNALANELEQALTETPMFDIHTHLVGGKMGARGLHDVMLYHMVVSDLYAAGCPSGARRKAERTIRSLADVQAAVKHYVDSIPYAQLLSTATHISTDINYCLVSDAEMESALQRRGKAGPAERDLYASYVNELFLSG